MDGTIPGETKREGQRKAKRRIACGNQEKRRKLMVGTYSTHSPSHVACMQIMKSNNNERFRIHITHQNNFPFYRKGLKTILTHYLKN
jgi:hypothetical protein